jgi:hypothetical protein
MAPRLPTAYEEENLIRTGNGFTDDVIRAILYRLRSVAPKWHTGSGAPSSELGEDGDLYLRTTNGAVYGPKADGAWGLPACNITGPKGLTGADGSTVVGQIRFSGADASEDPFNVGFTLIAPDDAVPAIGDKLVWLQAFGADLPVAGTDVATALVDDDGDPKVQWLAGNTSGNVYVGLLMRPAV